MGTTIMLNLILTAVLLLARVAAVDLDGVQVSLLRHNGVSGTNGTVFLKPEPANPNWSGSGLLCADGVDDKTAELLCNQAGYKYLIGYNTTWDFDYYYRSYDDHLDCDTMIRNDISVLAANLTCPGNATHLSNCTAEPAGHFCDADTVLWLDCTNDDGLFWKLTNVTLAHNKVGTHNVTDLEVGGKYGTVLMTMNNTRTGEERTGLVPYTYDSDTLKALCYFTGHGLVKYTSGDKTGERSRKGSSKISCGYIIENKIKFALKWLDCYDPMYYQLPCRYNANVDTNISVDDALWLKCS